MDPKPVKQEKPAIQKQPGVEFRVIVVGIVQNEAGEYLICKMPKGRGVFPDQWGLPGGGIEEGEMMEAALRRELREELGTEISDIKPLFFTDGQYEKSFADGTQREVYMIFLIFSCKSMCNDLVLAPEFSDYAWVRQESLMSYHLNSATIATFKKTGIIKSKEEGGEQWAVAVTMLKLFYLIACIFSLINGAWMLLFPYSWYTDLPAAVPHTGPFNQHFVRDLGVVFIVVALAFAWSARNIDRAYPVHLALTFFFAGHALIHLVDIVAGRLPHSHWLIDAPGVFLPALIMIILAVPSIRARAKV